MALQMCTDTMSVMAGLSQLYAEQQLTDVRLVCADGALMAHKSVLAAVSDKFKQMVSTNQSPAGSTTLIVFADLSIQDIKTLIDCIYFGRQTIESKRFKQLTRIANDFGIKLTSAVSAALTATKDSMAVCSNGCTIDPNLPKPAHQNSLLLGNKKPLKRKQSHNWSGAEPKSPSVNDIPLDLSITADIIEDNVRKIIDSIATNGPQTPTVRRRKQSEPKQAMHISKSVRFDESNQSLDADHSDHNYPLALKTDDKPVVNTETSGQPSAIDNITTIIEAQDNSVAKDAVLDIKCDTELKPMAKDLNNVLNQLKSVGRSPKNGTVSEVQLKDCCVCGKTHSTHKQLILHLNKEHKVDDLFKCAICGKEQKYAKTFAVHSIHCLSATKV